MKPCPICDGMGEITTDVNSSEVWRCRWCQGSGRVTDAECERLERLERQWQEFIRLLTVRMEA